MSKTAKKEAATAPLPGAKTGGDLSARLRKGLNKAFYNEDTGEDRVVNRALRYDPLEVFDFPTDFRYKWVPAPGHTAPEYHNAAEMAQRRAEMVQRGWNYYPAEEFGRVGSTPWMPEWVDDEGRVRSADHWLMYTDRDLQERKRAENLAQWNRKHDAKKQAERREGSHGTVVREFKREPLTERELLGDLQSRLEEAGLSEDD